MAFFPSMNLLLKFVEKFDLLKVVIFKIIIHLLFKYKLY